MITLPQTVTALVRLTSSQRLISTHSVLSALLRLWWVSTGPNSSLWKHKKNPALLWEKTKIAAQWMFLRAVTGWEPGDHTHQIRFKLRFSTCHNFASRLPKLSVLCHFSMCLFAPNRPLHIRHPIISLLLNSLHHRRLVTTENSSHTQKLPHGNELLYSAHCVHSFTRTHSHTSSLFLWETQRESWRSRMTDGRLREGNMRTQTKQLQIWTQTSRWQHCPEHLSQL